MGGRPREYIRQVAFSPDGKLVLACYDDPEPPEEPFDPRGYRTLTLWDVTSGKERWTVWAKQAKRVAFFAFLPDGRQFLAKTAGRLEVRDTATGKALRTFLPDAEDVQDVAVAPDSKSVLLQNHRDGRLRLLTFPGGRLVRQFEGRAWGPGLLLFSADGKMVLATSLLVNDDTLTAALWSVRTGRVLRAFEYEEEWQGPVAFSPDSRLALVGRSRDGAPDALVLLELPVARELKAIKEDAYTTAVAFTPDGRRLLWAGLPTRTMKLRDLASGRTVSSARLGALATAVAFSSDGRLAAEAGGINDGVYVRLWDPVNGKPSCVLGGQTAK
jgi:WD40 repeat protein